MQNNFIQEEGTGYRIDQPEKIPSQYTHLINYCKKRLQDGAVYFNRTVQCGELIFWMAEVSQALSKKELLDLQQNILKNYKNLKFGSSLEVKVKKIKNNPKRLQREVKKQSKQVGIGTKSQLALQKQREEMKLERKTESKKIRELEIQRKFELKQEKRRQKHRGK